MFNSLFDMDRPFWHWVGKIPEIMILSFFWYLCSLPIITIIPASCALYDAVSRNLMPDTRGCYARFFHTFWKELKQGIPLSLFWLLIAAIGFLGDRIVLTAAENDSTFAALSLVYRIMLLSPLGLIVWLVPLQSRYYNRFVKLHANALRISIGLFPRTLLLLVILVVCVLVCFIHPITTFLIIFAPCTIAIFHSKIVEKGFMKVFPHDYDEDGQLIQPAETPSAE